jgi:hypothetical protein
VIVGAFVGLLQWRLALKDMVDRIAWILAILIANSLIVVVNILATSGQLIPKIFEYYSVGLCASCDLARLHETWFSGTLLYSIMAGLAAVVPTGVVLFRTCSRPPNLWLLGGVLAFLAANLLRIPLYLSSEFWVVHSYFLIGPLVIALISAPFLYATLHL